MATHGSAQSFLRKTRSDLWEQFTRKNDSARHNLSQCGKEYKYCLSALNLHKHLRTPHTDAWKEVKSAKTTTKPIRSWMVTKGNSHNIGARLHEGEVDHGPFR